MLQTSPTWTGAAMVLALSCAQPQEPAAIPGVASTPEEMPAIAAPAPAPAPTAPALTADVRAAREQAETRLLGKPMFSVDPETPEGPGSTDTDTDGGEPVVHARSLGRFVALEGAGSGALAAFHDALRELSAGGENAAKVRVTFYGSSQTAADYVTTYLRVYLQHRFGDGGHGFVALATPWRTYRHLDVSLKTSKGWRTDHAQKTERLEDGYYGLLGASTLTKRKRDRTTVHSKPRAAGTHYELHYLMQPKGGKFLLDVDGKRHGIVATSAEEFTTGYEVLELELGAHDLRIRPKGDGEVRLFGVVIENASRGVVVDTLGINGARAANHLVWNEPLWADAFRRRSPALYVLAYGGNEAGDDDEPIERYRTDLGAVLDRFARAAPDASCLLVGPGDYPHKAEDESYRPRPRLQQIIAIQRETAAERGCAFWDTQAFMGGPMSMTTWVKAEPAMARPDHLHLTRRGYGWMGMALTDAIMYAYDAGG